MKKILILLFILVFSLCSCTEKPGNNPSIDDLTTDETVPTQEEDLYDKLFINKRYINFLEREVEYQYHVTGGYRSWNMKKDTEMTPVSLRTVASYDEEIAAYLAGKDIKALYMATDFILDNKPTNPYTVNAFVNGEVKTYNQGYAIKCFRAYDEGYGDLTTDTWIPDPKTACTENFTPNNLFIPKWVEEPQVGEEHLGKWSDLPVCIGGAGKYTVIVVEYNVRVGTLENPNFGMGIFKIEEMVETPLPGQNEPTPDIPTDDPATNNPIPDIPTTEEIIELSTPVLTIDEETGVVTWEVVPGATHYNYIINDGEILSTTSTTITLTNESNISIQAANETTVSDWSKAVTFFDTSDIEVTPDETVYVYFYDANLETLTVKVGEKITKPTDPTKANCEFDNWYSDPFGQNLFDFNEPILSNTIVYAKYNPNNLINNVYFWVKASPKIYSDLQSSTTSQSGWRFIPLKVNVGQTGYIEYMTRVTVAGASETEPAEFIVMDGFTDDSGRTYWKKGESNFTIKSDGVYDIYFAAEHKYDDYHILVAPVNNSTSSTSNKLIKNALTTPIVSVDSENNIASWQAVKGALKYEVILNNGDVLETNELKISIAKNTHVTVRAIGTNEVSNWSVPKANRGQVVNEEEITKAYVYFDGYDSIEVDINSCINAPTEPTKDGYTFGGWYLDINYKTAVSFPYTVEGNTVFYPKWNSDSDYTTKEYYQLVDASGNKICGLTWNLDNFDFDEFQTPKVKLTASAKYYIKSLDGSKTWGPYSVSITGNYNIYFSEDYLWNNGTENASNVYIASEKITVYFSNNKWWDKVYIYMWNSNTYEPAVSWPGSEMKYEKTNCYGEKIYSITIDLNLYDYIIFTNDSGEQTHDISLKGVANNTGYYLTGSNKYDVATYEYK